MHHSSFSLPNVMGEIRLPYIQFWQPAFVNVANVN